MVLIGMTDGERAGQDPQRMVQRYIRTRRGRRKCLKRKQVYYTDYPNWTVHDVLPHQRARQHGPHARDHDRAQPAEMDVDRGGAARVPEGKGEDRGGGAQGQGREEGSVVSAPYREGNAG
jgi:hypothetical protein